MTEQTKNESPLRVTYIEVVNFKGLRTLTIEPGDKTFIQIVGANCSGKTSALDALIAALCGKRKQPEIPIRTGAKEGHVAVVLAEDLEAKYRIERHWRTGKSDVLKVWSLNGSRKTPLRAGQTVLEELIGDIGLDPYKFLRADAKEQVAMLMAASGLGDFYEEAQANRVQLYEDRTDVNREVKRLGALIDSTPDPAPALDLEVISNEALAEKMEEAQAHNAGRNTLERAIRTAEASLADWEADIRALQSKIADLENQIGECEEVLAARKVQLAEADPPIDAEALQSQLTECSEHNIRCQQQADHREYAEAQTKECEKAGALTDDILALDAEVIERLNSSELGKNMPGLKISDGGVFLNDVPLKQICGWEGLHVSALVCMAATQRARILCIDEADGIDDASRESLCDLATERGYQIFMTCVRSPMTGDPDTEVCFLRDGEQVPC
jgi:recombinational DNA repair ATPase RecF